MSFNRWQKLIAARTENAVVAARCEAKAGETLTSLSNGKIVREA